MDNSFFLNFLPGPRLHNHISKEMEVGFTQYGPLLGVSGTIQAVHKVIFVDRMSLEIKSARGGAGQNFEWFAFRPHGFILRKLAELDYKMPSKFMVPSGRGHPYDILFCDRHLYGSLKPVFRDIKKAWSQKKRQAKDSPRKDNPDLFEEFLSSPDIKKLKEDLSALIYWQAGDYELAFHIKTAKPPKTHTARHKFMISEEDAHLLSKNSELIFKHLCEQSGVFFESINTPLA